MPDFMNAWWDSLNFNLQLFYGIGILALVVLALQAFLMLFTGMDTDFDVSGAEIGDHDSGLGVFSIRGVTAFFVGFGWAGVICTERGLGLLPSLAIAVTVGSLLMVGIYLMMRSFMRLQDSGTLDYANAVGQVATVYVTIPPNKLNGGQVETMIQGRLVTAEALQYGDSPLAPGSKVKVVDRVGTSTLVVEEI